jgi:hypothetical protein
VARDTGSRCKPADSYRATLHPRLRALGLSLFVFLLTFSLCAGLARAAGSERGLELITPASPVSALPLGPLAISADGSRTVYSTLGTIPGAPAGDVEARSLATREAGGWHSEALGAPYEVRYFSFEGLISPAIQTVSDSLTSSILISFVPLVEGGPTEPDAGLYRLGSDGDVELLAELDQSANFLGASGDLSHAVFDSPDHLLPSDAGRNEGHSVYESVGSTLRQVDLDTGGSLLSACGSSVPSSGGVSKSGDRIFFLNPSSGSCGGPVRAYLREAGSRTIEISASSCSRPDCGEAQNIRFAGATPDGSVAFLVTDEQLTNEDEDALPDLYRFDVEDEELSLVSVGSPGTEAAVEESGLRVSADGARVYFYATGSLLTPQEAEAGRNLYLADASGPRLVGPVRDPSQGSLQISADGRFAAITTAVPLLAADGDESKDVYLFDAFDYGLTLLSRGGGGPFDATTVSPIQLLLAPLPGRSISDDGRVFFGTKEALIGEDHNQALDVYEWHSGILDLVSQGEGRDDAELASSSADGSTVVFRTKATLLPRDRDGGDYDLYAARLGGGFAEVPLTPPCGSCGVASAVTTPTVRPRVATTGTPPHRRRSRIELSGISKQAGRQFIKTGHTVLAVSVPAPGKVSAVARGSLGGKARTLGHGVAGAVHSGKVKVLLQATDAARRALVNQGVLHLQLIVRQGPASVTRRLVLRAGD